LFDYDNFILFRLILLTEELFWGLGIGDWAQSPIPNPQSPTDIFKKK